jgi:integrase
LAHIVAGAAGRNGYRDRRNHAIVALHCFSGLQAGEIAALRRLQVIAEESSGQVIIEILRAGRFLRLPLPEPAAVPLLALLADPEASLHEPTAYVFRRNKAGDQPLSAQALRAILVHACKQAGLPGVTAADLRAAFAYWLRLQGLSEHEAATVLGLEQARSLDRLLARHKSLDAQRQVRELYSAFDLL